MATEVDICNIALSYLGDRANVTSISPPEGSAQADHCARFYPIALQEILQRFPWTFATVRATLPQLVKKPDSVAFAYALPSNCLRILSVYGAANWEVSSWNIERTDRELILVSEEPIAYVVYLTNRVPVSQFSPVFVEALAHLLAAKLAGAIMPGSTGADVLTKQLQAYEMYAQKVMALDARQVNESMRIRTPYTGDLSLMGRYGDFNAHRE